MVEAGEEHERKKREGPTFFGGGRLGNAAEIEAAARNGENWSKPHAIVLNSNKSREAQLRALAAAETRRLGSSGRLADKRQASILQAVLAGGNMHVAQALHENSSLAASHDDVRRPEIFAEAAMRRQQALASRGHHQQQQQQNTRTRDLLVHTTKPPAALRLPHHHHAHSRDSAAGEPRPVSDPDPAPPPPAPKQYHAHREGLSCDLDLYASMQQQHRGGDGGGDEDECDTRMRLEVLSLYEHVLIWHSIGTNMRRNTEGVRATAAALNCSSFLASPRAAREAGLSALGGERGAESGGGEDLLARARALIAAGEDMSAALKGVKGLGGGAGVGGGGLRLHPP